MKKYQAYRPIDNNRFELEFIRRPERIGLSFVYFRSKRQRNIEIRIWDLEMTFRVYNPPIENF